MLTRILLLAVLATSCRSQYQMDTAMRSDITFNDENDRYDVGNIIQAQKQLFQDLPSQMENAEGGEGFRRNSDSLPEVLKRERRRHQRGSDTRRMDNTDFAYHEPLSRVADDVDFINDEYGTNLATFKTYSNQNTRRTDNIKYNPSIKLKLRSPNRRMADVFFNLLARNALDKFKQGDTDVPKKPKRKEEQKQYKGVLDRFIIYFKGYLKDILSDKL